MYTEQHFREEFIDAQPITIVKEDDPTTQYIYALISLVIIVLVRTCIRHCIFACCYGMIARRRAGGILVITRHVVSSDSRSSGDVTESHQPYKPLNEESTSPPPYENQPTTTLPPPYSEVSLTKEFKSPV